MNVWQNFPDWLASALAVAGCLSMVSVGIVTGRHLV